MVPPQLAPPQLIARGSTNSVNKYSPGVANIDKYAPSPKQSSAFLQDHVNTSGLAYNQSPMPPYLPSNSQVGESPSTQRYDPPGAGNNKIYGYQIGAQNSTSSVASIGNINNNMHSSHQYHHHHHNNNNNNQQPPSGSGNQYTPGHKKQFSGSSIVSGEGLGIDFSKMEMTKRSINHNKKFHHLSRQVLLFNQMAHLFFKRKLFHHHHHHH